LNIRPLVRLLQALNFAHHWLYTGFSCFLVLPGGDLEQREDRGQADAASGAAATFTD
jgi:hypothetical protein